MNLTGKPLAVIDAPSNLGLRPLRPGHIPGTHKAPAALRRQGIVERLGAADMGEIIPAAYSPDRDPALGVRNAAGIRSFALELANRAGGAIDTGQFPIVLGGDCSILLGDLLALRHRGRTGLAFIDGHLDFRHPGNDETRDAAGEDLALATGRGSDFLANLDGLRPLVLDRDVVALGFRNTVGEEDDERLIDEVVATEIEVHTLDDIRRTGAGAVADATLARLTRPFWIHVDVDVLDLAVMPAVDSPQRDGLTYAELGTIMRALLRSGQATGLEVTIFDPDLDPDGSIASMLVDAIVSWFAE